MWFPVAFLLGLLALFVEVYSTVYCHCTSDHKQINIKHPWTKFTWYWRQIDLAGRWLVQHTAPVRAKLGSRPRLEGAR